MGRFGRITAVCDDKTSLEVVYSGGIAQVYEGLNGKRHSVVLVLAYLIHIHDCFRACAHACEIEPVFAVQHVLAFK